jgi:hypothetical protein
MTTAIRRRRGTTTQHSTFTGLEGEVTVDTTKDTLVVHDGSTAGGHPLAKENNATLAGNVTLSGGTANGVAYLNGSKVVTTGSALVFDSANRLGIGVTPISVGANGEQLQIGNAASTSGAGLTIGSTTTGDIQFSDATSGTGQYAGLLRYVHTNDSMQFWTGSSEQMRLTSTGLGIGTSSPGVRLDVAAATAIVRATSTTGTNVAYYQASNTGGGLYIGRDNSGGSGFYTGSPAYGSIFLSTGAYPMTFATDSTERMRIDSSGNLGLGVTPSAWASSYKALQIKGISIWSPGSLSTYLSTNLYSDGTNRIYINNGYATEYTQVLGQHQWFTAASGTAGNAITFTQAMTLDASGNLGIGVTTLGNKLEVNGGINMATTTATVPSYGMMVASGVGTQITSALHTAFYNNGSERARITSGGEVYIAGTTDQGAYNLQVNGTGVWGAGAYVNGSDARLKEEVQDLAPALDVIASLRPVTFRYKEDYSKDQNVQPGFIAQELQTAMAGQAYVDGVIQSGPQYLNVAYQSLIPLLTKAIQEQQGIIESLTSRIAALEGASN